MRQGELERLVEVLALAAIPVILAIPAMPALEVHVAATLAELEAVEPFPSHSDQRHRQPSVALSAFLLGHFLGQFLEHFLGQYYYYLSFLEKRHCTDGNHYC